MATPEIVEQRVPVSGGGPLGPGDVRRDGDGGDRQPYGQWDRRRVAEAGRHRERRRDPHRDERPDVGRGALDRRARAHEQRHPARRRGGERAGGEPSEVLDAVVHQERDPPQGDERCHDPNDIRRRPHL
jgi:hypothetical protein